MTKLMNSDKHPQPHRLAGILAFVTLIAAVSQPLWAGFVWLFWGTFADFVFGDLRGVFNETANGPGERFAGFLVSVVGALAGSYGLLGLRQTFVEARDGRTFSTTSLHGFRRFAWSNLFLAFYGMFQYTALVAIFSFSDPSTPGALSIKFGTPELRSIFMAMLLVFFAGVLAESKQLKDEYDRFL